MARSSRPPPGTGSSGSTCPIGLILVPLAALRLAESHGPSARLDLGGLALGSTGLFGIVFGLVRSQSLGWTSPTVLAALIAGALLVVAFVAYERRIENPMLPMEFFAVRGFAVTNAVSLAMYFGMFGSIFFLSQFLQNVLGQVAAAGRGQAAGVDRRDDAGGPGGRHTSPSGWAAACSWSRASLCRRWPSAGWPRR